MNEIFYIPSNINGTVNELSSLRSDCNSVQDFYHRCETNCDLEYVSLRCNSGKSELNRCINSSMENVNNVNKSFQDFSYKLNKIQDNVNELINSLVS